MDDPRVAVAAIQERIGALDGKVSAAHARIDRMETLLREDLKDIKSDSEKLSEELKGISAWMNQGKGWAGAFLLLSGLMGGLISQVFQMFVGKMKN